MERSSEGMTEKLKTEAKLRRQAEMALTEAELELRSKLVRIRQLERGETSALRLSNSGVITETVNNTTRGYTDRELEVVTDELISTQERLRKADEQLQRSQTLVQDLERKLQHLDNETSILSGDEKELLRELEEIRAEIGGARDDIESHSSESDFHKQNAFKYEAKLKESREENLRLEDEITCLRKILHENGAEELVTNRKMQNEIESSSVERMVSEIREAHQSEIKTLRKQIEDTLNENMTLQEEVNRFKLEEEVNGLKNDLLAAQEYDVTGDEVSGETSVYDLTNSSVEDLLGEKLRKTEMSLAESKEECSELKSEILSLEKSLHDSKHSRGETMSSNEEIIDLTSSESRQDDSHSGSQNEIEDKKDEQSSLLDKIFFRKAKPKDAVKEVDEDKKQEIIALEKKLLLSQEEVKLLSTEISHMNEASEKAQENYNSIVGELKQTKDALAAAKDTRASQIELAADETPEKKDEINFLKVQLEELNAKNEHLECKIKDTETMVLSVQEKQIKANAEIEARAVSTKELETAVAETKDRNSEAEKLAFMVENRINITETKLEMLEGEIAEAMWTLETQKAISTRKNPDANVSEISVSESHGKGSESMDSQSIGIRSKSSRNDEEKSLHDVINKEEAILDAILDPSERLLEISERVKRLSNLSSHVRSDSVSEQKEDEKTTDASYATISMHSGKGSKYEEIIQKVAEYESLFSRSKEKAELEARGEDGVSERERSERE